ncbi:GAF domain-containing protein [Noviherbaspirillum sp. DKR-6]|uniref:histidine kinase n=2 Tax=Noviherbaspirillum pedocola TaxID=2801341 RepID=A0A934SUV9_9BURK|nr:GAF domain-containing protein [Noviherbaspirillum pedocola]
MPNPASQYPFSEQVDLTECDREPIHIPGSIQPHGFLLSVSEGDCVIQQISANTADVFGMPAAGILGQRLESLIGEKGADAVATALAATIEQNDPIYVGIVELTDIGCFDVIAHCVGKAKLVEFEPVDRSHPADFRSLYSLLGAFLKRVAHVSEVEALSDYAVRVLREVTGFGRVFLYVFDHNDDSQVIAETLEPSYPSYIGQRFPASDIPAQARKLYTTNPIRLIPNANYQPSPLVPPLDPVTNAPTDLSHAVLRAVSPVHVQYMKNMGTIASMSISLVIKGRLWGMISCHNATAKYLPFEVRTACEQLGQILALRIESIIEGKDYAYRLALRGKLVSLLAALSQGDEFVSSMGHASADLLNLMNATGAALVFEGRTILFGDTPDATEVTKLVEWLAVHKGAEAGEVFHTRALSRDYPAAERYRTCASGMLAVAISGNYQHYVIWFRPEVVRTVEWAGNPEHKAMLQKEATPLSPRKSFESWRQTVRGTSDPWQESEIETALEFRGAILGIVLARAEEMAALADELGRANKELESFSYSVSHDLRAPMRHIVGYTDLLLDSQAGKLDEQANRHLRYVGEAARFAGKLVDDLLSFSQMGRAALHPKATDMNSIVKNAVKRVQTEAKDRTIHWKIDPLPTIECDPTFIELAVFNLVANAVKYSRGREVAEISISSEQSDDAFIFHVRDNGVGFSMEYAHKLFAVFQRLHRMDEFEGTGIGLANVRRIVERHGGHAWAEGTPDQGAVFSFSIPKTLPA